MPEVTRSIEIQAPPSAVWRWLSSPEALRQWLSPTLEIDLRVGGAYHLLGPDEETRISGTGSNSRPRAASSCRGWKRAQTGSTRPGS